jgi:hypothetical protein
MQVRNIAILLGASLSLAGCARWHPQRTPGLATFDRACPLARAPRVAEFGPAGVRGAYHFVIQGATSEDLEGLARRANAAGFRFALLTIEMNGVDTKFAGGPGRLHDQHGVDEEFRAACRLGRGPVYLTHVRYNPAEENGPVRVR